MLIDWSYLAPAMACLLLPVGLFHTARVRHRPISRNWIEQWREIITLPHHVFDLVRAAVGAWLLLHSVTLEPTAAGMTRHVPAMIQAAILVTGVLLQTFFCKEPDALNAPFAYLCGLVAGFLPPVVAAFALLIALVVAMGARSAGAFFLVLALAVAGAGVLFTGKKQLLRLAPICVAAVVPLILALLFGQELVITHWIRRTAKTRSPWRQ